MENVTAWLGDGFYFPFGEYTSERAKEMDWRQTKTI